MSPRLTFRGLPAEGLGDCCYEAPSPPIRRVGADRVPGLLPEVGLSWAVRGVSKPRDRLLGGVLAYALPFSGGIKNMAASAVGLGFSGLMMATPLAIPFAFTLRR